MSHSNIVRLVGGPARCGKSTLARKVAHQSGSPLVHVDYLRPAMEAVAAGNDLSALRLQPKESDYTFEEWISAIRKRDLVIWQGVKQTIANTQAHGDGVVIDGGLWPDYVAEISKDHHLQAVFLVETDVATHTTRLNQIVYADDTENNWMRGWSKEKLTRWAQYNVARSLKMAELAGKYGFPVFDITHSGLTTAQDKALEYLFSNKA